MEELHAAIAAHLRRQRRTAEVRRPLADTERHYTQLARDAQILAIWCERRTVPHCIFCGRPVDDDDGLYNLDDMRKVRECALHHTPL